MPSETTATEDDQQGETQQRWLPAISDRVSLPERFTAWDTDHGIWTTLHSAAFLLFSTLFLFAGAGIPYQVVTTRLGLQFEGAALGVVILGTGIVRVGAAVAALYGYVRAPVATGILGIRNRDWLAELPSVLASAISDRVLPARPETERSDGFRGEQIVAQL